MPSTADTFSTPRTARLAPVSLNQLGELLAGVQRGESPLRLGARSVRVLAGMLAAPRQSARLSITELGREFGVHPSTLSRLAKSLGYRGFAEFQAVFRRHIAQRQQPVIDPHQDQLLLPAERACLRIAARVAGDGRENISGMLSHLDPATLVAVVGLLLRAVGVRVHGSRQSYAVANYLCYTLGLLRADVAMLGDPGHGLAHALGQLNGDDLLLVCGGSPQARSTLQAAQVARDRGVPVVAVTDKHASPLADLADYTLYAPTDGSFFGSSMASVFVLVEVLTSLLAEHMGPAALAALKSREAINERLQVEL